MGCDTESNDQISYMIYQLLKEQSSPSVVMEKFERNPLQFTYFGPMFPKSVKNLWSEHQQG